MATQSETGVDKPLIRLLGTVYGPYAFGIISLLIIWYSIVQPTLANNRIDTQSIAAVAKELAKVADSVGRSAELVNSAVQKMDRLAEKLENIKTGTSSANPGRQP